MEKKYATVATSSEIDTAIDTMALKLIDDYHQSPLFIALLRGAAPFASKLMFAMSTAAPDFQPELDYMVVSTYGKTQKAASPQIVTDLSPQTTVENRSVVIIDDVLDTGVTADFIRATLFERGARDVKLAVLAQKLVPSPRPIAADYCGFDCGDKWLVGMGMDDASSGIEHFRWGTSIREVI